MGAVRRLVVGATHPNDTHALEQGVSWRRVGNVLTRACGAQAHPSVRAAAGRDLSRPPSPSSQRRFTAVLPPSPSAERRSSRRCFRTPSRESDCHLLFTAALPTSAGPPGTWPRPPVATDIPPRR